MSRGVESYMHLFAKQTVASWLRGGVRVGQNFKGLQPIGQFLPALPQTAQPMMGVYEEFPIALVKGTDQQHIGLSIGCEEKCEHRHGWDCYAAKTERKFHKMHGVPTAKEVNECKEIACKHIFDVAVISGADAKIVFVVEICHKNPIDAAKVAFLNNHNIRWFELSAEWVMNQVRSPFSVTDGIVRDSLQLKNLPQQSQ